MADALAGAKPLDAGNDALSGAKSIPPPSVMDPNKGTDTLKRIGRAITDPKTMVPLAVGAGTAALGMAVPESAPLLKAGASILGGALSPYAEYAASKAVGGNPDLPDWKDSARGAILNGMFEMVGGKSAAFREGASKTGTEIAQLPEELRTPVNIRAAVKNRDFLKKLGMNDDQITDALKDPAGTAEALQRSVDQGRKIADTFKQTIDGERGRFKTRYDGALGEQAAAPVDNKAIASQMRQIAAGQGQHELTPTFKNFLMRKADEIDPPLTKVTDPLAMKGVGGDTVKIDPNSPAGKQLLAKMKAQGLLPEQETKPFTVKDARDLNTELHENAPSGQAATNLDKQAVAKLDEGIKAEYGKRLTQEQVGQLDGIDKDYAMFQKTISGLRPGSKDFGEQTADAFFQTAKQNPTLALNFVRMAQDSGTMPEFRESFLKQLTQEMRGQSGGPVNQMQVLRKLQDEWRTTEDGKAVLGAVFGKNSPMADPLQFSKVIGSAGNPKSLAGAKSIVSNYIRSPEFIIRLGTFYATYSLIVGSGSSPWSDMRKDPERAMTGLIGAMLTLGGINKVMSQVAPPVQRAYSNWVTTGSPNAFANLIRMTGATTTALATQPETPTQ